MGHCSVPLDQEPHATVLGLGDHVRETPELLALGSGRSGLPWARTTLLVRWLDSSSMPPFAKTVRLLALLLRHLFQIPYKLSPFLPLSTWWGCSDASADSFVGGWISDFKSPDKSQVWWFHFQVTKEHFPWAFKEGDPQKRIAAVELLGTLVLCRLLLARQKSESSSVRLPIGSDNQGNVFSLLSFASKKPHTAAVLMELVWQLHLAGCSLAPCRVPRELNQWADEFTHVDYGGFSEELRLDVSEALSHFILLPRLMSGTHIDFSTPA